MSIGNDSSWWLLGYADSSGQENVITWTPSKDGLEPMAGVSQADSLQLTAPRAAFDKVMCFPGQPYLVT